MTVSFFTRDISPLLLHQIRFEALEVLRHLHALFSALHEGGKASGDFHLGSYSSLYGVLELGWMSSLAEHATFARLQLLAQCAIAAGTVRIKYISVVGIALLHGLAYLFVAVSGSADERCHALVVALV